MKEQLLFFILFFIITLKSISQEHRKFLYANIKDKIGAVYNAHIINLNTNQGTNTNESGEFRILAKQNDSLQMSFIGYKTAILIIKNNHFGMLKNNFLLEKETYKLDEVVLKKHNLKGIISMDMKQTPENIAIIKSKGALDFTKINFKKSIFKIIDEVERAKAPNIWREVDPTAKFFGIGGSFNTGSIKNALAKRQSRKNLKFKENFPRMLISEFGENFFFKELKIPKDKYYHFLEYCNSLNIEGLYKNRKVLEMIKILQQESKNYLKIINSQE